jgi:DNA-binding response OmpR family regulator
LDCPASFLLSAALALKNLLVMTKKRILIVDDEVHIRTIITVHLSPQYYIQSACDGYDALQILSHTSFDLMIVDIMMPRIKGVEVIVEARTLHPDLAIIAISGADERDIYLKAAALFGAETILHKPFKLRELEALVAKKLGIAEH